MSMVLTRQVHTMAIPTCSLNVLTSTSTKLQVLPYVPGTSVITNITNVQITNIKIRDKLNTFEFSLITLIVSDLDICYLHILCIIVLSLG